MMSKPKLLTWHDFLAPTGFSVVAENLLKGFEEEYNIEICSINYKGGKRYDTSKYFIHPLTNRSEDPLNVQTLYARTKEWKPDLIFIFQDIFNIDRIVAKLKELSPNSKIVSYFPTDGMPLSPIYKDIFNHSDYLISYTHWALKILKDSGKVNKPIDVLYHGVDSEAFFPIPDKGIQVLRKEVGWEGKFVMGLVAKNQPRKQIESTLRTYGMFVKGFKECKDCGHKMPITQSMCELCSSDHLIQKGREKKDTVLYLHTQMSNPRYGRGPSYALITKALNCGFTKEDFNKENPPIAFNGEDFSDITTQVLNEMYNCINVHVTSTVGEGCGLPILEAMATGTPSIAPRHSAIPEMMGDTGRLVKNKAVFTLPQDNGHFRPIIDEEDYLFAMEEAYLRWRKNDKEKEKKPKLVTRALEKFSWKDKRESLKNIFKQTLLT